MVKVHDSASHRLLQLQSYGAMLYTGSSGRRVEFMIREPSHTITSNLPTKQHLGLWQSLTDTAESNINIIILD